MRGPEGATCYPVRPATPCKWAIAQTYFVTVLHMERPPLIGRTADHEVRSTDEAIAAQCMSPYRATGRHREVHLFAAGVIQYRKNSRTHASRPRSAVRGNCPRSAALPAVRLRAPQGVLGGIYSVLRAEHAFHFIERKCTRDNLAV